MNKKIVLTGGGTAGHVNPNIALIETLQQRGWQVEYVGSKDGIEKEMISAIHIPYHAVSSGKLRRYFSWQNFQDPLKIFLGIIQSWRLLQRLKPDVVFSKGGFVAFPVVVGAWLNRIPIVAHESDITPGLANRLSFPFVDKICLTFAAAKKHFKNMQKVEITGTPLRQALFSGKKENGLSRCHFNNQKPCLLVIGGSQGAKLLNLCVREAIDTLCERFQVIHLCGRGKVDPDYYEKTGYYQLEYAAEELADFFAASDVVISRAGANALYEILALQKPHVLVPLSSSVSRGDQVQNACYFQQQGISRVINETELAADTLLQAIDEVYQNREAITAKIKSLQIDSASNQIIGILEETVHAKSKRYV